MKAMPSKSNESYKVSDTLYTCTYVLSVRGIDTGSTVKPLYSGHPWDVVN